MNDELGMRDEESWMMNDGQMTKFMNVLDMIDSI